MLVVISHYNDAHFDFGGDCGVSFFFILSGFVLSLAYSDKISEGNFCSWSLLKRQWKKVYPLHIMTFLVMVLFDMRLGYHHSISALIANMLLMQSWIPSKEVYFMANGPSWFLCDIIFFYVVFSKLNHTLMKAGKKAIIVLYSIIITCYAFLMLTIPSELINPVLYVCVVFAYPCLVVCCKRAQVIITHVFKIPFPVTLGVFPTTFQQFY